MIKTPKYTKGDLVIACSPDDQEKVIMYEVIGAEIKITGTEHLNYWWYSLRGIVLCKEVETIKREDILSRFIPRA